LRNLAKDLVTKGEVFEPPLVFPDGDRFFVADGNRRTTCLKLLANAGRAPTVELQQFFADLRKQWPGKFPEKIECRVETDRDRVDDILYRRHTGVQGGIGQSNWNDRMKNNFVIRTGKSTGLHVADEIERRLKDAKMLPSRRIPRSNLNRLLSAGSLRNRLGISVRKGKLEFIREEQATLRALQRVATDLATREAEIVFLRHQLLRRRLPTKPRLTAADRLLFVWLYRLVPSLLNAAVIIQPDTIVRWHRAGFRSSWRWKSRSCGGRPKVAAEVRSLIRRMSLENSLWGAPRIHGELLKLGNEVAQLSMSAELSRRIKKLGLQ
jgi:hypothetical protein